MTNSVRPSPEAIRTGIFAVTLASERGGRPAIRRSTGTIMSWKVNIAEVGNPGRITTGLPSQTARHSGLPRLSPPPLADAAGEQRPARGDDARRAEPRDDSMGDIARTFRGTAGQYQHVAVGECPAHGGFECF